MSGKPILIPVLAAFLLAACAGDPPPPPRRPVAISTQQSLVPVPRPDPAAGQVVATVNGQAVTMAQLQRPLVEAYGLNVLLQLVQLQLAKQEAAHAGLTVSPADVEAEGKRTLDTLFQDANKALEAQLEKAVARNDQPAADKIRVEIRKSNDQLLDQFLAQQRISRPELGIVFETNANLRKLALKLMPKFTDDDLLKQFNADYGEQVRVRHVQCDNLQEIMLAKAEIAKGAAFEEVAKRRSRNEYSKPLGGELPPFSRADPGLPEEFKNVAFGLKVGEVSDPVECGGTYHVLKLLARIAPKAVKFDSMKDVVQQKLEKMWVQAWMLDARQRLAQLALQTMQIKDPVLADQFDRKRREQQQSETQDRDKIRQDLAKQRERDAALLAAPATAPAATRPASEPDRPPATQSGAPAKPAPDRP